MEGWQELINASMGEWFTEVAFPAFDLCPTQLYPRISATIPEPVTSTTPGSPTPSAVVNPAQLRALNGVLRSSPHSAWLILLHHQVVEYPVPGISLTDRVGLALLNAAALLEVIAPHAPRTLILHGHRHVDWIGTTGATVLCSAPSVTLGPEKYRGRFAIHEFALGTDGSIQLTANERVKVTGSARQLDDVGGRPSQEAA